MLLFSHKDPLLSSVFSKKNSIFFTINFIGSVFTWFKNCHGNRQGKCGDGEMTLNGPTGLFLIGVIRVTYLANLEIHTVCKKL